MLKERRMMQAKVIEAQKNLPEVLNIQKKKLVIALKQAGERAGDISSAQQEMLVQTVTQTLQGPLGWNTLESTKWDDSEYTSSVTKILTKHAAFQLEKYLLCANKVRAAFVDKDIYMESSIATIVDLQISMEYLLTYSRQFADPSERIFNKVEEGVGACDEKQVGVVTSERGASPQGGVVEQATQLIQDLHKTYDEDKFRKLNTIATSFTLIILRRFIKLGQSRHSNNYLYRRQSTLSMIVHAYYTTGDEKTKKNLYDSCIKYMEWHDMHLPSLFFRVLDRYNIGAEQLWDAFISTEHNMQSHIDIKIKLSLLMFAQVYYDIFQQTNAQLHLNWFPFCRFFDKRCHTNLSDEQNVRICMVLDVLLKMVEKSVKKAQNNYTEPIFSDFAEKMATDILKIIAK